RTRKEPVMARSSKKAKATVASIPTTVEVREFLAGAHGSQLAYHGGDLPDPTPWTFAGSAVRDALAYKPSAADYVWADAARAAIESRKKFFKPAFRSQDTFNRARDAALSESGKVTLEGDDGKRIRALAAL